MTSGQAWFDQHLTPSRRRRITHLEVVPARAGEHADFPEAVSPRLREALDNLGIHRPWRHQAEFAEHAFAGRSAVISTGTASGKTLGYWLPTLSAVIDGTVPWHDKPAGAAIRGATVLYLAPTKALAADQLRALGELGPIGVRAGLFDGDTPQQERGWVRQNADYVLTNPDMLHHGILPGHERWSGFLRSLRYVVIDECHTYRGVFGAHTALLMRRLRRICSRYGTEPVFLLASATMADPGETAQRLIGAPAAEIVIDTSPRPSTTFALWEPPLIVRPVASPAAEIAEVAESARPIEPTDDEAPTDLQAGVRRSAIAEGADLLTDLVVDGVRTLAFVRSRKGVETLADITRDHLSEVDPSLVDRVAAYRGGYLPEERRALEKALRDGTLLGLATTNALELGVDVNGLDAVLMIGWPGTRASVWQQAGRAGRADRDALAVLIARDDPLDSFVVHHPEAVFGRPTEAAVFDPDNPYVLAPHLCAAAAESPLRDEGPTGIDVFGVRARDVANALVAQGALRRRATGWFWTSKERATDLADLRGTGGTTVRIIEESTGRMLGTVDAAAAHRSVHAGAIYVHQGQQHLVVGLDDAEAVAVARRVDVDYSTHARTITEVSIVTTDRSHRLSSGVAVHTGLVDVTTQVVAFARRRLRSGEALDHTPLELEPRTLRTASVWWTLDDDVLEAAGIDLAVLPGAAHAAEHASIGLLPLTAICDRSDLGGLSTIRHADTGLLTVFVHDAVPGGGGFSARGYDRIRPWLETTRNTIAECPCSTGCPSCIQSPKCGNGNEPLHKAGAIALLDLVLA